MPQSSIEQQAMERVRRMYGGFDPPNQRSETQKEPSAAVRKPDQQENKQPQTEEISAKPDLLASLMKDHEKSLILLLLLLLYTEKADASTLLALMYLIL